MTFYCRIVWSSLFVGILLSIICLSGLSDAKLRKYGKRLRPKTGGVSRTDFTNLEKQVSQLQHDLEKSQKSASQLFAVVSVVSIELLLFQM